MSFKRWEKYEIRSWAFSVFKQYHTHLNRMIWSQIPTIGFIEKQMAVTPGDAHVILKFEPEDERAVKRDKSIWKNDFKEFNNWTRLNTIMSLSSYLEIYLSSIISTAIESNPGILHNASKKIDGAIILKNSNNYTYAFQANKCVIGEWAKRLSEFKNIFQSAPAELEENIGELEKLRILRNNIGHAFGRDIDLARKKGRRNIIQSERITLKRIKHYLKIVNKVVVGVDTFMLDNHIGDYEALYHYHEINSTIRSDLSISQKAVIFKRSIGKEAAIPRSKAYCRELIMYYDSL